MNRQQVLTYSGGMDQDTSVTKRSVDTYYKTMNMRILNDKETSTGSLSNIQGTLNKIRFINTAENLLGYCQLDDSLIFFTEYSGNSYIYQYKNDGLETQQTPSTTNYTTNGFVSSLEDYRLIYTDDATYHPSGSLNASDKLNFGDANFIRAIGKIETENIKKIYWVDGIHSLRSLNIIYDSTNNPIDTYTQSDFNLITNINFGSIDFNSYGSGNLNVGEYCYSYQLYNLYDNETSFSPTSPLIPTTDSILGQNTETLKGGEADTNSGKSIIIDITNIDTGFQRIKVVVLEFKDSSLSPTVRVVLDSALNNNSSIEVIDTGESNGILTLEEFRIKNTFDLIPNLIESKNNYLVVGDITVEEFDLDSEADGGAWDARAYRFNSGGVSLIYSNNNDFTDPSNIEETILVNYPTSDNLNAINPTNVVTADRLITGTHTGVNDSATLTDSALSLTTDGVKRYTIYNITDGSSGLITANTSTTITATLSGGIDNDWDTNDEYYIVPEFIYKSDGNTLGASGKNISVTFTATNYKIDDNGISGEGIRTLNTIINSSNEKWIYGIKRTYRRDEIYRFGIVFYDRKGRRSKPKWICDLRIPAISTSVAGFPLTNAGVNQVTAKALNPTFTISNCPQIGGANLKWQIVRLPRTEVDKTIITQGVTAACRENDTDPGVYEPCWEMSAISDYQSSPPKYTDTHSTPNQYDLNQQLFEFISPEVNFSQDFKRGEKLTFEGSIYKSDRGATNTDSYVSWRTTGNWAELVANPTDFNTPDSYQVVRKSLSNFNEGFRDIVEIGDISIITNSNSTKGIKYSVGGYAFSNYIFRNDVESHGGFGGTKAVIKTNSIFNLSSITGTPDEKLMICNYKRDIIPYGGNTYNDRLNNTYIQASDLEIGNTSTTSYRGDTFICFYDYLRTIHDASRATGDKIQEVLYIPLETDYNLFFRNDDSYHRLRNYADEDVRFLSEQGYVSSEDGINWGALYQYNFVYNRDNTSILDVTPVDTINTNNYYSTRIYNSNKKLNGEIIDSWQKFLIDNYIDVDSQFGNLTRLINYRNNVIYFQPKAIGYVAIEERELLQGQDATTLVLGTGGVLQRYDYVDKQVGCSNYEAIILSNQSLYFYDKLRKIFNRLESTSNPISTLSGMNSWFRSKSPSDILGAFDPIYNEILLTLDNDTIVFNEFLNKFTSFYDINPNQYIQDYNKLYSTVTNSVIYEHNVGLYNFLYNDYSDPYIILLSNPARTKEAIFNNIDWYSEVLGQYAESSEVISVPDGKTVRYDGAGTGDPGHYYMNISGSSINITGSTNYLNTSLWKDLGTNNNVPFETLNSIYCYNSIQQTDNITLVRDSNINKRFNKWYTNIPRDNEPNKYINARMRDTHLYIKLLFQNDENKQLKLGDTTIYFNLKKI